MDRDVDGALRESGCRPVRMAEEEGEAGGVPQRQRGYGSDGRDGTRRLKQASIVTQPIGFRNDLE